MTTRTFHAFPVNPEAFDTGGPSWIDPAALGRSICQQIIQAWRDMFRARYLADGVLDDATGYTISDIFRNVVTTTTSYFFIHRDNANGIEHVIGMAESTTTSAPDMDDWLGGSGATYRLHVKSVGTNNHTTSPQAGMVVFFNKDISIESVATSVGFDDGTALTFGAGDFQDASFNPDSPAGLALLRPAHCQYGLDWALNGADWVRTTIVVEDDATDAGMSLKQDDDGGANNFWYGLMARASDNTDGGDTDTSIVLQGYWISDAVGGSTTREVYAFDPGGTLRDYDWDVTVTEFSPSSYILDEGGQDKYDWRVLGIINGTGGSGSKGSVKESWVAKFGITDGNARLCLKIPGEVNGSTLIRWGLDWGMKHQENAQLGPFGINTLFRAV